MDIGEIVAALTSKIADENCSAKKGEYAKQGWEARLNKWGTLQKCSGGRLYRKMKKDKDKDQGFLSGPVPYVDKVKTTKLSQVGKERFNIQAHHLIPKNFLPDQKICAFLAKGYGKAKDFELHEDAPYSCDHANNGYCLPYATPLAAWKKAKNDDEKLAITYKVMDKTGRQLHQGSHRTGPYEDPSAPGEEDDIHKKAPGYLDFIKSLLEVVFLDAQGHPNACENCKPDDEKKIPPREDLIRHMDQVSGITKLLVDAKYIFISKPAFLHWGPSPKVVEMPSWLK